MDTDRTEYKLDTLIAAVEKLTSNINRLIYNTEKVSVLIV